MIPLMDASAKQLSYLGYSIVEITWARFFFNSLIIIPVLLVIQRNAFNRPVMLKWQFIRVACLLTATFCYFSALKTTPLADALAIYFIYPFVITIFAPFILSEDVGVRRYIAVVIGFIGILIIVRPGLKSIPAGVWFLIIGACCFAFYNLFTRRLVSLNKPAAILLFQSVVGTLVMTAIVPFFWKTPDIRAFGLFLVIGGVSALAHYLLIVSYRFANASLLAPFAYFEIISATLFGFVFFGDFPDRWTWLGMTIIIFCGIYISFRERIKDGK